MLTTVLSSITSVINCMLAAASAITSYWIVGVAVAFLIIGYAISFIFRFAGGKKKTKKKGR